MTGQYVCHKCAPSTLSLHEQHAGEDGKFTDVELEYLQTYRLSVTNVPPRPSSFVEIILVMIITQFLSMLGVYVCLDQTLLVLTIEAVYRRHHRQHEFL